MWDHGGSSHRAPACGGQGDPVQAPACEGHRIPGVWWGPVWVASVATMVACCVASSGVWGGPCVPHGGVGTMGEFPGVWWALCATVKSPGVWLAW